MASDFSHQLNQPLTALRGSLELALMTARTPDDFRKSIETALEQTDRIIHLTQEMERKGKRARPSKEA